MGNIEFSSTSALKGVNAKTAFDIDRLVRRGKTIEAIRIYRDETGVGLAEAKETIDKYMADNGIQNEVKKTTKKKGWFGL